MPTGHVGPGRWVRDYTGPVDVFWGGATGDGVTDDSNAIQAVLATGLNVHFSPCKAHYRITIRLRNIADKQIITGSGPLSPITSSAEGLQVKGDYCRVENVHIAVVDDIDAPAIEIVDSKGTVIRFCAVTGYRGAAIFLTSANPGTGLSCNDCTIENNTISGS